MSVVVDINCHDVSCALYVTIVLIHQLSEEQDGEMPLGLNHVAC